MANHISVVIPQDSRTYIHWDADGVETVPPSEAKDIPAVVEELRNIQRAYFDKTGRCYSGLHATTTHEVVKGTFVVPSHLPAHLRQSDLFANEGVYPVACRYYTSEQSAPGRDHDDDDYVGRSIGGFDLKIFGVRGVKFPDGPRLPIQDLSLSSNSAAINLADAKTARAILDDLRSQHADDLSEVYRALETMQLDDAAVPSSPVSSKTFNRVRPYTSQTASRFGKYIARYRLVPTDLTKRKLEDEALKPQDDQADANSGDAGDVDALIDERLRKFHSRNDVEYELQVQLCEDLEQQPVEDIGGAGWDEEKFPFQTVAKLVIPRQEGTHDPKRLRFWDERVRINPWNGLVLLQPLGGASRLQRVVYPASDLMKSGLTGQKSMNVLSITEIP